METSTKINLRIFPIFTLLLLLPVSCSQKITTLEQPARLEIREAGEHSIRITLKPTTFEAEFPYTPALAEQEYSDPVISILSLGKQITRKVGNLIVRVSPDPLTVKVTSTEDRIIQEITFMQDGNISFLLDDKPVLGMGEGGPRMGREWQEESIEFDRRGRFHEMAPRWQSNAYGSRNPVALLAGTKGWGLFMTTPWVEVDMEKEESGMFIPWDPPSPENDTSLRERDMERLQQGRPPADQVVPGVYDLFVFDAADPAWFMKDVSVIGGQAVMPPKYSLGYMQSHRTLEDENQLLDIVDTFREKEIPLDAVIYLGTGFCPRGWNTTQPSFDFNPEVFLREPAEVIADLHSRNVKVITHIVPWSRDKLPTLSGWIPPGEGETVNESHMLDYWNQHIDLVNSGVDAWWPDEGDWFNLFERIDRHRLYYQGPISTQPDLRPWSLHRNGHLGVARWGGWVWSGDTESSWKTLEGQVAVGINHSLSLSPYWGSDIGGFYPGDELTGELYVRWFQFGAFCPSFRSHGRTWWTRLPWGWGLSEMGPLENSSNPSLSELNNPTIEPVCRQYDELRYQLLPYNYTLAWEARSTGLPFMRAMWLHYPDDREAIVNGSQYLWGRALLIAPVFEKDATSRDVYLPEGIWYDWFTNARHEGRQTITREVDLSIMPIFVCAGAIIPFDPVRQYTSQKLDEPTTLRIYTGTDGDYTLYTDDGISNNYLEGVFSLTHLSWNNEARKLIIEPATIDGVIMPTSERTFRVALIPGGETKEVRYTGTMMQVSF
ncbi:MAG TPA: TIM-barrel domain-containing protein [Bacteroidales bacterium]|nr:TIM-barrel domain-containing protein [Bacteroidales bacterium]